MQKILNNMINTSLDFVTFKHLSTCPDIRHGIFSRLGGYSNKPYDSLNVGNSVGDEKKNVLKNRQKIIEALGGGHPVFINQVHGKKILVLKKEENNVKQSDQGISNISSLTQKISEPHDFSQNHRHYPAFHLPFTADGVITNIPGFLLFIQVADCQPVILYDPVNKVAANIHSGWKGSLQNIIGEGVDTMKQEFGSDPEFILAGIGPSLGPCCSEFINYHEEIPEKFWIYKRTGKHFDFWRMSIDQLMEKGVKYENIELSRICTKCSHDSFFSYRHKKITGRFASVIGMV